MDQIRMAGTFDEYDRSSWYFKGISRQEVFNLLLGEEEGSFLVRDSISKVGNFVICVSEKGIIKNYMIDKIGKGEKIAYTMAGQTFPDIPQVLAFYKLHELDTTPLVKPVSRRIIKVRANDDFAGKENDDLAFEKGEILTIVRKNNELRWTAKNSFDRQGLVPVDHLEMIHEEDGSDTSRNDQSQEIWKELTTSDKNRIVSLMKPQIKVFPFAFIFHIIFACFAGMYFANLMLGQYRS